MATTSTLTPGWAHMIEMRAAALSLSIGALSVYVGIGQSRLSAFITGVRKLDNQTLELVDRTLTAIEKLVDIMAPIPLDLRKTEEIQKLLKMVRDGDLASVRLLSGSGSAI